jgi:intein/homing endonuclease/superfamily II DNA or RNA helicase
MVLGDSVGLGKCVDISTWIPTSKGLIRLSELLPDNPVPGEYYPVGDETVLLSYQGPMKPSCIYYAGDHDGIEIQTNKGFKLSGLGYHPIYAPLNNTLDYRRLDTLVIGDYVCINRESIFTKNIYTTHAQKQSLKSKKYEIPSQINEDLAELLGFYVSEGSSPDKYHFTITQWEKEIQDRIRNLLNKLFGYKQNTAVVDYDREIRIHSIEIFRCLEYFGIDMGAKSGGQSVPESVLKSNRDIMRSFLRAYFEGDGSFEATGGVSCSSKSEILVEQIQQLLLLFGIVSKRKVKMVKVGEERRPYHILYFFGSDVDIFAKEIGFISLRKSTALRNELGKKRNTNLDIIPIGRELIKAAMTDVIAYLKQSPEHRGFSIKGSGWKGLVGYGFKRQIDELIYSKRHGGKKLSYNLLKQFIQKLEENNLSDHVKNYTYLKEISEKHIFFDKITKITKCTSKFADFCVPGYHNFTGNGFINHNTVQAISAYAYLLVKDPTLKLLVVTTKSAAQQWADEFETFSVGITTHVLANTYGKIKGKEEYGHVKDLETKGVPFKILRGFEARKAQYENVHAHVFVCNYHAVQEDYIFLIQNRMPNFTVAFDECQSFKNQKSQTYFGANEVAQSAKRVYGLSATIIKNKLEEAYNIYNVIVPGLFGGRNKFLTEYTIRKKMELWRKGKKQRFNKIVGYQNLKKFKDTIEPFFLIRRTREVADELPRLISKKLILELTSEQDYLYKQALSGELYKRLIKDKFFRLQKYVDECQAPTEKDLENLEKFREKYEISLTTDGMQKNKIAGLAYCQLASNGPGWLGETGKSSKEIEFERLFEQELMGEKVIVFTRFKSGIPRLEKILDDMEEPVKHTKITGDNSSDERTASKKIFQDTESGVNVIFITGAGSAAINLQAAKIILFYDTPWSYGDLYQTIGRAQRIGSIYEHICLMHMVNKNTIDEHVLKILESKKSLINNVMGDIAEGALDFKDDEVLFKDDESSLDALYSAVFG